MVWLPRFSFSFCNVSQSMMHMNHTVDLALINVPHVPNILNLEVCALLVALVMSKI